MLLPAYWAGAPRTLLKSSLSLPIANRLPNLMALPPQCPSPSCVVLLLPGPTWGPTTSGLYQLPQASLPVLFSKSLLILFLKPEIWPASFAWHNPTCSSLPRLQEASLSLDYSLAGAPRAHRLNPEYVLHPPPRHFIEPDSPAQTPSMNCPNKYCEFCVIFIFISVAPRSSK